MIAWLRTIFTIALITILTGALGIIAIVAALFHVKDRPGGVYDWVPRTWSKLIMRVAGIKVRVHGFENAGGGEPRIFVSNHMSLFDVPALSSILPRNRFVAKAELFKIPIFGGAIRAAGMIEIQRDNKRAAFDSYKVAGAKICNGISIVVFPEGTRGIDYPISPFKKGPFILAIAAQVPIVPVIIHGTREIVPKGEVTVRPGMIDVHLLDPVPVAGLGYEDRDVLTATVRDRMVEAMRFHYGVEPQPARARGAAVTARAQEQSSDAILNNSKLG